MRRSEVDIKVYVTVVTAIPSEFAFKYKDVDESDIESLFYEDYINIWFGQHGEDADIEIEDGKVTITFNYETFAIGEYVPADETSNGYVEWQFTTHASDYNVPSEHLIDFDYEAEEY
jgi:hypothetical protein